MRKIIAAVLATALCLSAGAGNARYVNMFMGTAGDHGQVTPAAQMPFGLASVIPDSVRPWHAGYDYEVPEISGISVNRISGTGGDGTGGNMRVLPAAKGSKVSIVKGSEKAVPGYYAATLDNGVKVELTASMHCAVEKYTFPRRGDKVLYVDFDSGIDHRRNACSYRICGGDSAEAWVKSSTVCNKGAYKLYFRLQTSEPFTVEQQDATTAVLRFEPSVRRVEVRVGMSSLGEESAACELDAVARKSFRTLRKEAASAWDRVLSKVDVKGSTKEQRTLFYTSLYRVYLSPFDASFGGLSLGNDGRIHDSSLRTFYSGWSMWDTFRTKFPMFTLLDPEIMSDICQSLSELYQADKRNWANLTEPVPTVRTEHSQITMLDAWSKGVRDFDMASAFPAMEREADAGRVAGARDGLTRNAPDQMMETIYDLWAMSQIAEIIGNSEAAGRYLKESGDLFEQTWKKEFMNIDEGFSLMRGNGMYQGTRWQYRWAVPVFAGKMKEWVDEEELSAQLDDFFRLQMFNQGNEPDIQTPFMFHLFAHPEKTDSIVHALLTDDSMVHRYGGNAEYPEPYVGRAFRNTLDGYALEMDEDDGTMSAWYMFSQMGFYPVCVGTDTYAMFTPLFDRITLHLSGHDVVIRRKCAPASAKRLLVDGKQVEGFMLSHNELVNAKEIIYE